MGRGGNISRKGVGARLAGRRTLKARGLTALLIAAHRHPSMRPVLHKVLILTQRAFPNRPQTPTSTMGADALDARRRGA